MIPVISLGIVFLLIMFRRTGRLRFQIWQAMLLGALAVLALGQISPLNALRSINPDVMFFLFGMFIVGEALEASGYLAHLSQVVFRKARTLDTLVLAVIFAMGLLSAVLMNDTLAIIGTPVVLTLARRAGIKAQVLLLALAFAITIGSAMSPIGNPQNLLIAIGGGIANPFVTFSRRLLPPTVINLLVAYLFLRLFYRREFTNRPVNYEHVPVRDPALARLSRLSLALVAALIGLKVLLVFIGPRVDFRLTYIALVALPLLLFSPRRLQLIRKVDWSTLVFFASMFVLMESVWDSGMFQSLVSQAGIEVSSTGTVMALSIILSQFISNVPLVALYLPLLKAAGMGAVQMMALAAGSTIAGNVSILGAASNVIIIQNAEQKAGLTIGLREFVRIGIPLTAANALVYWLFLQLP